MGLASTRFKVPSAGGGGGGAEPEFSVSGGTMVEANGYRIITCTESATLTVTGSGVADVLLVGGGGGGGGAGGGSGGGGAGGFLLLTGQAFTAGTVAAVVGVGGAAGTSGLDGVNGGDSSILGTVAYGGGGGGRVTASQAPGLPGGSGGGGGRNNAVGVTLGGAGVTGQGHDGGTGTDNDSAAGGGGAFSAGVSSSASLGNTGAAGGAGIESSITGAAVIYAAGGGGGGRTTGGAGGSSGVGGNGAGASVAATAPDAHTGSGGGGGWDVAGSAGAGGVIVVRYAIPGVVPLGPASMIGTRPSVSSTGANALGVVFAVAVDCNMTHVRLAPAGAGPYNCRLYNHSAGTTVSSFSTGTVIANVWNEVELGAPIPLTAGDSYILAIDIGTPFWKETWPSLDVAAPNGMTFPTLGVYAGSGGKPQTSVGDGYAIDGVFST